MFPTRFGRASPAWKRFRRCFVLAVWIIVAGVISAAAPQALCAELKVTGATSAEAATSVAGSTNLDEASVQGSTSTVDPPPAPGKADGDGPLEPCETNCCCPKCVPCLNEFWIVNTRCLPTICCCGSAPFTPRVTRYSCREGERPASLDELVAPDGIDWLTVMFLHGHLTTHQDCVEMATKLMCRLPKQLCSGRPVRLILWSWPSDVDVGRARDDTANSGQRAATESYYLGRLMTMLDQEQMVYFIGYSFGARITTGACHLLAGRTLGGRCLIDQYATSNDLRHPRFRAMLWAAAIDEDWLIPGHFHGAALESVEHMTVTINPRDVVLSVYRVAEKRNSPPAIGAVGPPVGSLGQQANKLRVINVKTDIGRKHGSPHYIESPRVASIVRGEMQTFDATRR